MTPAPSTRRPDQFALLRQRRFGPFFWTQFLGAANDNVLKFAFTLLVTYQWAVDWLPPQQAGMVIGAVFIAPFLLLSATCGQIADKFDKDVLARRVKELEILIMLLGTVGLMARWPGLLLGCIALLGVHSTLFGPVKYAYLPQQLHEDELTGGNGMVEMGTFVAILLGNTAGGLLVAWGGPGSDRGLRAVAAVSLALAVAGRIAAGRIPPTPAPSPGLRLRWNPFVETWRNVQRAREDRIVFRSLLGISWMWFFGAVFLSLFPPFARDVLHGDEQVASLLLVVFSVGVGLGALACERFSHGRVEVGLVPLGAIGMTVFALDLWLASGGLPPSALQPAAAFISKPAHWRVLLDLFGLAAAAGIYSVPMYALVQLRSPPSHRARIVATNNILNAAFMIASALIAGQLLARGVGIPQLFGLLGAVNALVLAALLATVPDYRERLLAILGRRAARHDGR